MKVEVKVEVSSVRVVCRDADETNEWIDEKDEALNLDDYGHDLATVQRLQRKHEGLERDLAALGEKVRPAPYCSANMRDWRGTSLGVPSPTAAQTRGTGEGPRCSRREGTSRPLLQRKHEGLERDLAALGEKVRPAPYCIANTRDWRGTSLLSERRYVPPPTAAQTRGTGEGPRCSRREGTSRPLLQRKHEGLERDLAALGEKMCSRREGVESALAHCVPPITPPFLPRSPLNARHKSTVAHPYGPTSDPYRYTEL